MLRLVAAAVVLAAPAALTAPAAAAYEPPRLQYASALEGTDAFVGIAKQGDCFKAYLSDGTERGGTLSVWFQGCLDATGRHLSATRGGVSIDADIDRRAATGTVTLRDGMARPFSAQSGDGGGIVGRRFRSQGRRYRSGWVVLRDNRVRWRITPIGRGLYGEPPVTAGGGCDDARQEHALLRAQLGPLLEQSGRWELRLNRGSGPTSGQYNRLSMAIGALDERSFALEHELYGCT